MISMLNNIGQNRIESVILDRVKFDFAARPLDAAGWQ